jgi:hypothetical protein
MAWFYRLSLCANLESRYRARLLGGNMRRSVPWRFILLSLAISSPAAAQVIWDMPNVIEKKPTIDKLPVLRPRAEVWPRLDPGAVVCKTEADLLRLAEARRGVVGDRPNCQLIREPTAIHIERRAGPGRTEVTLTDQNGLDGWTDAWLPDRAPPIGGKAVSIK